MPDSVNRASFGRSDPLTPVLSRCAVDALDLSQIAGRPREDRAGKAVHVFKRDGEAEAISKDARNGDGLVMMGGRSRPGRTSFLRRQGRDGVPAMGKALADYRVVIGF